MSDLTKGDTLRDKRESIDFSGQYYSLEVSIRHSEKLLQPWYKRKPVQDVIFSPGGITCGNSVTTCQTYVLKRNPVQHD